MQPRWVTSSSYFHATSGTRSKVFRTIRRYPLVYGHDTFPNCDVHSFGPAKVFLKYAAWRLSNFAHEMPEMPANENATVVKINFYCWEKTYDVSPVINSCVFTGSLKQTRWTRRKVTSSVDSSRFLFLRLRLCEWIRFDEFYLLQNSTI